MVQEELAATEAPQVEVPACPNGPLTEIVNGTAEVAEFLTVKEAAALDVPSPTEPNAWDEGESAIGAIPVPVNEIVCVPRLSATEMAPVRVPMLAGLNVMEMMQLFVATSEVVQVVVTGKFALFEVMLVIPSAAVPLFLRVTFAALLLELTATEPKVCDVADNVAVWANAGGTDKPKSKNVTTRIAIETRDSLLDFMTTSLTRSVLR
jgi:hypothetical protein